MYSRLSLMFAIRRRNCRPLLNACKTGKSTYPASFNLFTATPKFIFLNIYLQRIFPKMFTDTCVVVLLNKFKTVLELFFTIDHNKHYFFLFFIIGFTKNRIQGIVLSLSVRLSEKKLPKRRSEKNKLFFKTSRNISLFCLAFDRFFLSVCVFVFFYLPYLYLF